MSPDGQTDVIYSEINNYFPTLSVDGGTEEYLYLLNIPEDFDGWGAYCLFTNGGMSVRSEAAVTHVMAYEDTGYTEDAYTEEYVEYAAEG